MTKTLLDHKADITPLDERGKTALSHAARYNHIGVMTMLLEHGSGKVLELACNKGRTPLLHAVRHGHAEATYCLLLAGANCLARSHPQWLRQPSRRTSGGPRTPPPCERSHKGDTAASLAERFGHGNTSAVILRYVEHGLISWGKQSDTASLGSMPDDVVDDILRQLCYFHVVFSEGGGTADEGYSEVRESSEDHADEGQ